MADVDAIDYGSAKNMKWLSEYDEVRFTVFYANSPVTCRVTGEYLSDHCGNPRTAEECLEAARDHFDAITDLCGDKITKGTYEEDGTILVRSSDG